MIEDRVRTASTSGLAGEFRTPAKTPPHRDATADLQQTGLSYVLERIVEITIAVAVLLLFSPILIVLAIIIRFDSPGPALYVAPRLGRFARPFRFVKFRTMYVDARTRFPELYRYQYTPKEIEVLKFKVTDDPRLTNVGRWLRKTSLDELPNFWNVLTGDIALVGPRPEIPEMLPYYKGEHEHKFDVKPGITGYAQTAGRGHLSFQETVRLDIAYVRERSLITDMRVVLKTIKMILVGNGAF